MPAGSLKNLWAEHAYDVHPLLTVKRSFLFINEPTAGQAICPLVAEGAPANVSRSLEPHVTESTKLVVVPTVA